MFPIKEQQWNQVNIHKWEELDPHLWECFRVALMELSTSSGREGITTKSPVKYWGDLPHTTWQENSINRWKYYISIDFDTETDISSTNIIIEHSKGINDTGTELQVQGVCVEFSPIIVSTSTEMLVNIVVSDRDYLLSMLDYLPWYERKSNVFNSILKSYAKEFRRLEQDLEVVKRSMFIDTSIESLDTHERDLGIKNVSRLGYDQRREQISSRYRASFDQTTEETIKSVASAYSNGEVEVNPTDVDGLYEIKFIGAKGIPNNIEGLKQVLDIIMPAHLGLKYTFTFNAWEPIGEFTWGNCLDKTWNDLRIWDEVS